MRPGNVQVDVLTSQAISTDTSLKRTRLASEGSAEGLRGDYTQPPSTPPSPKRDMIIGLIALLAVASLVVGSFALAESHRMKETMKNKADGAAVQLSEGGVGKGIQVARRLADSGIKVVVWCNSPDGCGPLLTSTPEDQLPFLLGDLQPSLDHLASRNVTFFQMGDTKEEETIAGVRVVTTPHLMHEIYNVAEGRILHFSF
ncbi:unnamed protein product [Vitrella brassicaformis CCMP3155]|uniref:Uncharacterized protein n=1 Tax=Vitrella brassicaformis (strain CCMP3155) TaxID=1169540 RepID=A0A0G4F5C6_VITBC|nr:unnamed protein product [Vitrella brassicaformis CCMP3155]|eukprot:CEM07045.1 unnamed protein product [Vitrella brassicaformis CCMP3155]